MTTHTTVQARVMTALSGKYTAKKGDVITADCDADRRLFELGHLQRVYTAPADAYEEHPNAIS